MIDEADGTTIGRQAEAALVVGYARVDADGGARLPVRLSAPGVGAMAVIEIEAWSGGPARLAQFFDDLAGNWRGWTGPKEWRDDAATFALSATHDRKGLVVLRVTAVGWWRDRAGMAVEDDAGGTGTYEPAPGSRSCRSSIPGATRGHSAGSAVADPDVVGRRGTVGGSWRHKVRCDGPATTRTSGSGAR